MESEPGDRGKLQGELGGGHPPFVHNGVDSSGLDGTFAGETGMLWSCGTQIPIH